MLLSISIPTHHGRAEVLARALDSVLEQLGDDVEVCVSDNASEDATQDVVRERQARWGERLRYHRNPANLGLVPNLLNSVRMATGEFCWLLGSDDVVVPGGVQAVVELLRSHPETSGVTLNRFRVNVFDPGRRESDPAAELPEGADTLQVYDDAEAIFVNVGLSMDFMSTQILRRAPFLAVVDAASPAELAPAGDLAHLYLMGRLVQERPRWIWYPDALVQHTTGTSALDEQLGHDYGRYQLAVMEGRERVWSALFGGRRSPVYRALMRKAWLRSAGPMTLVGLKLPANQTWAGDRRLLAGMVRHFHWLPEFWLKSFPVLLAPHTVLKSASAAKQRLRPSGPR